VERPTRRRGRTRWATRLWYARVGAPSCPERARAACLDLWFDLGLAGLPEAERGRSAGPSQRTHWRAAIRSAVVLCDRKD